MLRSSGNFGGSSANCRVTDKLTQVHDRIWCCRSGSAADTQAIADIVHYYLQMYASTSGHAPTVYGAAQLFATLCYDNKDRLTAGIIVAGYDDIKGPQVYSIPLGGSLHPQPYAIGGSGSTYIYGYCDEKFRPDMPQPDGVAFARAALAQAKHWDGSSGGVTRLAVISARGVERIFIPDQRIEA